LISTSTDDFISEGSSKNLLEALKALEINSGEIP